VDVANATSSDRQAFREATRLAAELEHPGIVMTLAAEDLEDGEPIQLTESVPGHTLATLLERQAQAGEPMPPGSAARIIRDVTRALSHARDKGIFHVGLSAREIWVRTDGRVLIAGLGHWRMDRDETEDAALEQLRTALQNASQGAVGEEPASDSAIERWVLQVGGPTRSAEFAHRMRVRS